MRYGIHLPHAGEQATPALVRRHAERAEDLGLDDVWVSEHIIVPRDGFPRSPLFFDPVLSLTWAAAATRRIGLGTSVLVLPMRHPLPLAKELATLHNFSEGRLVLGAGSGWLREEFAALGVPFEERGRRLDEGVAMMRAVWSEDPVTFEARHIPAVVEGMTMAPMPIGRIPLWFGGSSEPALRRAARIGDGWHGSGLSAEEAARSCAGSGRRARARTSRSPCGCSGTAPTAARCARWSTGTRRSGWSISWWRPGTGTSTTGRR